MILYSVNYRGPQTSYDWSIVTIHKTFEGAKKAREQYIRGQEKSGGHNYDYCIVEINTDEYNDCIFDYTDIEEDLCVCYYRDLEYNDELEEDEND